jgi:hypothetical protein
MKKISTLFKKDPNDLSRVINEVDPENMWVYETGIPTRKFDGTACMIKDMILYKRYDVKKGKIVPDGAIPCCDPDPITGHWPHWVKCDRNNPADKWHWEGFDNLAWQGSGTFELCGPKVQGNPEKLSEHELIRHGIIALELKDFTFDEINKFLSDPTNDIEGIVFHDSLPTGRMCKIRKSDLGIKR